MRKLYKVARNSVMMVQSRSPASSAVLMCIISGFSVSAKRLVGYGWCSSPLTPGLVGVPVIDIDMVLLVCIGCIVAFSTVEYDLLSNKAESVLIAHCGARCSECSYFLEGVCSSCPQGDSELRKTCKIFQCSCRKRTMCTECDELLDCSIFQKNREMCPFGKDLFPLETGVGYVVHEREPEKSIFLFKDYTNRGEFGFLVSRQFPEQMQTKYKLEDTASVWLCTVEGQDNWIDPANLSKLHHVITTFIRRMPTSVVFFEGFEYLMVRNSFLSALKFVQSIMDEVVVNKCYLILSINPDAFNSTELALIRREFVKLEF
jgi:hypothetical protein